MSFTLPLLPFLPGEQIAYLGILVTFWHHSMYQLGRVFIDCEKINMPLQKNKHKANFTQNKVFWKHVWRPNFLPICLDFTAMYDKKSKMPAVIAGSSPECSTFKRHNATAEVESTVKFTKSDLLKNHWKLLWPLEVIKEEITYCGSQCDGE